MELAGCTVWLQVCGGNKRRSWWKGKGEKRLGSTQSLAESGVRPCCDRPSSRKKPDFSRDLGDLTGAGRGVLRWQIPGYPSAQALLPDSSRHYQVNSNSGCSERPQSLETVLLALCSRGQASVRRVGSSPKVTWAKEELEARSGRWPAQARAEKLLLSWGPKALGAGAGRCAGYWCGALMCGPSQPGSQALATSTHCFLTLRALVPPAAARCRVHPRRSATGKLKEYLNKLFLDDKHTIPTRIAGKTRYGLWARYVFWRSSPLHNAIQH